MDLCTYAYDAKMLHKWSEGKAFSGRVFSGDIGTFISAAAK